MPDYKQICTELVALGSSPTRSVSELAERMSQVMDLADRARITLAATRSVAPTDEELAEFYRKSYYECKERQGNVALVFALRAVLDRYNNR